MTLLRFLLVLLVVAVGPPGSAGVPSRASANVNPALDPYAAVRGMTLSCHGSGQVWGTDHMARAIDEVKTIGVNWITIHPYAGIQRDGTVTMWPRLYGDSTWLTRPITEAHDRSVKIMIKPHLAHWGSGFSWRGAIEFETDAQWKRFFTTYETWIARVAELAADADAFVVGTELDRTVRFEHQWRAIIDSVRHRTDAVLTYAANWDVYQQVPFWDALDAIAVQGYFPLTDHEALPTISELDQSWDRILVDLDRFAQTNRRAIVLAELGYNRSSTAARVPWSFESGGPEAEEVQRRCLDAALRALDRSPHVAGAFLWKWFPAPAHRKHRGDFLMSTPAMRKVIRDRWNSPGDG